MLSFELPCQHVPDEGFYFSIEGASLLLQAISVTKPGVYLTDCNVIDYFCALDRMLDGISAIEHVSDNNVRIFRYGSFVNNDNSCRVEGKKIFRFVSRDVWDKYLSKGRFKFSGLKYYRSVENINISDRKEGFVNIAIHGRRGTSAFSAVSGFNQYIVSATTNEPSDVDMRRKFGECCIMINNPREFGEMACRIIGASKFTIGRVNYGHRKIYMTRDRSFPEFFDEHVPAATLKSITKHAQLPSIFIKPANFASEREVRFAFEMPRDVGEPLHIESRELLRFLTVVDG